MASEGLMEFMRNRIQKGREQHAMEIEQVHRIAKINGRLIFINSAGRIPLPVQEMVKDAIEDEGNQPNDAIDGTD